MEVNFQEILDALPEKPPRSRLEPYRDLIEGLLNRGCTYREIKKILAEKCGLGVALSTLHGFMVPRPRAVNGARRSFPALGTKNVETVMAAKKQSSNGNVIQRPVAEVRQKIAALKNRIPTETKSEVFSYDPEQPLRLLRNRGRDRCGE
jgi:hypothetical protein